MTAATINTVKPSASLAAKLADRSIGFVSSLTASPSNRGTVYIKAAGKLLAEVKAAAGVAWYNTADGVAVRIIVGTPDAVGQYNSEVDGTCLSFVMFGTAQEELPLQADEAVVAVAAAMEPAAEVAAPKAPKAPKAPEAPKAAKQPKAPKQPATTKGSMDEAVQLLEHCTEEEFACAVEHSGISADTLLTKATLRICGFIHKLNSAVEVIARGESPERGKAVRLRAGMIRELKTYTGIQQYPAPK